MKLAELKEKFKNKYVIRMVCGVLMIAVLGSSSTVYTVYAAKNNTENEIAAESAKILGEETANVKEIGKEETVYIIADSEGKAQSTIVSEWLKNPEGLDVLSDLSELKGNVLNWQADGNDIYYQGITTKEAPVTEKITYYLDGKKISAKELAGKSGKVKIRFDYTNNEKNGDVYVPFAVVSGMILEDTFTNVQVTNGKVISNGSRNIVLGQ